MIKSVIINPYHCRKIAGAIRVRAGRNSVESGLRESLNARNHNLDDLFSEKKIRIQEKISKNDEDVGIGKIREAEKLGVSIIYF